MTPLELEQRLHALPCMAEFSPRMVNELASIASVRRYQRGDFIFREGTLQQELFIVLQGHVVLEMCMPAGLCTRLLTVGPSELLAWSAILGEGKMTTSAICQEGVEVMALEAPRILALCERDHDFGYLFMKELALALSKRLIGTRLQLLDMFATPDGTE